MASNVVSPPAPSPLASGRRRYQREETEAARLDRNFSELLQELRVFGAGVQILFAFLLGIAFQARFVHTDEFQRDVYLATFLLTGVATALMIAPVAVHRWAFREGIKDEIVAATNVMAIAGLLTLLLAMLGSILLVADWVAGPVAAAVCTTILAVVLGGLWVVLPAHLHRLGRRQES